MSMYSLPPAISLEKYFQVENYFSQARGFWGRGCRGWAWDTSEEETEEIQNHLHRLSTWWAGESIWEDSVSRHLHQGGAESENQAEWGQDTGQSHSTQYRENSFIQLWQHFHQQHSCKEEFGIDLLFLFETTMSWLFGSVIIIIIIIIIIVVVV